MPEFASKDLFFPKKANSSVGNILEKKKVVLVVKNEKVHMNVRVCE